MADSKQDAFYAKCLPQYFDHEWTQNGIVDRDCDDSGTVVDLVEYVCQNCGLAFTESVPAEGDPLGNE